MADVVIGAKLQLDANDGINSMKSFKQQLREAEANLVSTASKFGENSKQAIEAAKGVARLRDAIGDAKSLADAFNPYQKFRSLSQSLNGVLGGFSALTGAMGLLGVESDQVQKQLLKVQSAMALSQGLNQVGDSIQAFKNFGTVIVNTLGKGGAIGLAITGVTALAAALFNTKKEISEVEKVTNGVNESMVSFNARLTEAKEAIRLANAGVISKTKALEVYNANLGESFGRASNFVDAEKSIADNTELVVNAMKARATAQQLYNIAAQRTAEITTGKAGKENFWQSLGSSIVGFFNQSAGALVEASNVSKNISKINDEIQSLNKQADEFLAKALSLEGKIKKPPNRTNEKQEDPEITRIKKIKINPIDDPAVAIEIEKNKLIIDANRLKNKSLIDSDNLRIGIEKANAEASLRYEEEMFSKRIALANEVGNVMSAMSDLVGKQTAAGKVLALTQIGIDTAVAIAGIVRQASKNPLNLTGFAFAADIAARTATIFAAINRAKNILKSSSVNTGHSSFSPTSFSASPPLQAVPQFTNTRLDSGQLNQIGNAANPIRAFVVEHDITTNQDRIRRLNRAARI